MRVEVVHCPSPDAVERVELELPAGSTVRDALERSGLLGRHGDGTTEAGVWGRLRPLEAALVDGDRVELYRPLQVEPMQARRLRAQHQRAAKKQRP